MVKLYGDDFLNSKGIKPALKPINAPKLKLSICKLLGQYVIILKNKFLNYFLNRNKRKI